MYVRKDFNIVTPCRDRIFDESGNRIFCVQEHDC